VALASEHLGREVRWTSAKALRLLICVNANFAEAKVGDHYMAVCIEYQVVGLEVSKNNVALVQILDCQNNFAEVVSGPRFLEAFLFLQQPRHIAARSVVKEHEKLFGSLKRVFKPDGEWVLGNSEHISFGLCVPHQALADDLLFVQNFHRVKLLCFYRFLCFLVVIQLLNQINHTETALPEFHEHLEVSGTDLLGVTLLFVPNSDSLLALSLGRLGHLSRRTKQLNCVY
jgi:hypothetical protein